MYKKVLAVIMTVLVVGSFSNNISVGHNTTVVNAEEVKIQTTQTMTYEELLKLPCEPVERKVCIRTDKFEGDIPVMVSVNDTEIDAYVYNGYVYLKDDKNNIVLIGYVGQGDVLEIPKTINNYNVMDIEDMSIYLQKAFMKNVKILKLPEGTKSISEQQFQDFQMIEEVQLPEGVESIGENAFEGCSRLQKINFPEGLIKIGCGAFYGCDSLESINLPSTLQTIGNDAFSSWLGTFNVPNGVEYLKFSYIPYCIDNIKFESGYMKRHVWYYENGEGYCEFYKTVHNNVSGIYKDSKIKGIINKVNSVRKKAGKNNLKYSTNLTATAKKKVVWFAENGGVEDSYYIPMNDGAAQGYYSRGFTDYDDMLKLVSAECGEKGSYEYCNIGVACVNVEGKTYYWVIASIDNTGVTASEIKLKDKRFSITHELRGIDVDKIKSSNISVKKGASKQIRTRIKEKNIIKQFAGSIKPSDLTFKSSNSSIAKVDSSGNVKGIKKGTTKIKIILKSNTTLATTISVSVK